MYYIAVFGYGVVLVVWVDMLTQSYIFICALRIQFSCVVIQKSLTRKNRYEYEYMSCVVWRVGHYFHISSFLPPSPSSPCVLLRLRRDCAVELSAGSYSSHYSLWRVRFVILLIKLFIRYYSACLNLKTRARPSCMMHDVHVCVCAMRSWCRILA